MADAINARMNHLSRLEPKKEKRTGIKKEYYNVTFWLFDLVAFLFVTTNYVKYTYINSYAAAAPDKSAHVI